MQPAERVRVCEFISFLSRRELSFLLPALTAILAATISFGCGFTSADTQKASTGTLATTPSSMNFGDVEVGTTSSQTLTVNNSGQSSLTVSQAVVNGGGFAMGGATLPLVLPAKQSSNLTVQFAPTAGGSLTGSLSLVSNASNSPIQVGLTGRGVRHQLSASPSSINFGSVNLGATSSQQIILTNSGTANLSISQGTITGTGFILSGLTFPFSLSAGQTAKFVVQFAPSALGSVIGSVSITSNAYNSPTVIALSGTGSQGALSASPANVNFGNILVGSSGSSAITLTNSGTATVTISQAAASDPGFGISGLSLPMTLNGGQSATFSATFSPITARASSGSISITSNAPGSPLTIPVSGTGTQPQLTVTPNSVNFGNVNVNSTASQNISLSNSGTAALTVSQVAVTGTGFSMTSLSVPQTINPGASVSFTAQFAPASVGSASGSISITSNAPGSPFSISMTGTGTQGQLSAVPSSVSFGNVVTGTRNSLSIQLTNGGTASVTISQANVSGTGFTPSGLSTPLTIAPGGNSMFDVVFAPTAVGSVTGSVSLVSNAPNSPLTVALTGSGVAPTYLVSANPMSLSFGNVNVGASQSLSTTLTNGGNSNVTISSVTPSGAGYSTAGVTAGTILAPNQSATLNVTFAPTAAGNATGSISVASNATTSPTTVTLSGSGVQASSAPFPVWVMDSLQRVGQTDPPGTTASIILSAARGETVDNQVIVQAPSGGLTNVNLSASALTGPGGATIPASSLTLYREYYITVTGTASYGGGSNAPLGSGTYPEPLIPFNDPETGAALCGSTAVLKACNASVSADQNQPYWIDISVPHGAAIAPPGTYSGTISITSDQGSATVPVSLTVWNFGLPEQPTELSLWTLWPPAAGNTLTTLDQALMRNKVIGWYDAAANAASDTTNFGLNRSGLDGYYYIGIQCNGSYSTIPSTSQINAAAANFPAGLGLDFYLADELNGCTADYSPIKTMGLNAHAANRSVKTMMTLDAPDPNLFDEGDGRSAIDHWVLLDSMQQWPALPFFGGGSDLWSYVSCNTGYGNTPEWMVDYPPINERIQAGFLNFTQGATGILYYHADGWTNGNALASWNNVDTTACGGGLGRPGDGIFLYPPGPIASTESAPGIRLKAIRDGIQDYEYAHLLTSLGQVSFLNSVMVPIATSWTNWTHDPNALETVRQQLGQQLNLLAPPGN